MGVFVRMRTRDFGGGGPCLGQPAGIAGKGGFPLTPCLEHGGEEVWTPLSRVGGLAVGSWGRPRVAGLRGVRERNHATDILLKELKWTSDARLLFQYSEFRGVNTDDCG